VVERERQPEHPPDREFAVLHPRAHSSGTESEDPRLRVVDDRIAVVVPNAPWLFAVKVPPARSAGAADPDRHRAISVVAASARRLGSPRRQRRSASSSRARQARGSSVTSDRSASPNNPYASCATHMRRQGH
jgi:hypothetical protein